MEIFVLLLKGEDKTLETCVQFTIVHQSILLYYFLYEEVVLWIVVWIVTLVEVVYPIVLRIVFDVCKDLVYLFHY